MADVMKTVGRYEILREVGRGGMAMVYLARQIDLDRFVALKELASFHASDPSFAQRFVRESRVPGSLSHPNIVSVHDSFEHNGTPYIAMEYIERGSLRPYVGSMNLAQIGGVLEGLLAGLNQGEQHGIVHRDLKPENLMVTSDGRVKIADFGIAKATNNMQTGAFLTATGTTVGTPAYMAPEQAMAQDIGPPTDLYSVGCMAFEFFTGRVPFHDSEAPMAILLRHVNEQIPSVKTIDPKVDQDISDWIDRMLVKDPKQRTQSANDAWDEFEEIIIGLLGPRWRREARLREGSAQFDTPAPLTPAPFEGTTSDAAVSDEFQSFAWGDAVTPDDDGDSGFVTFGSQPTSPEEPVSAPAPAAEPEAPTEQAADEGFETYIAPAPLRPPTDDQDAPTVAPAAPEQTASTTMPDLRPPREGPPADGAERPRGLLRRAARAAGAVAAVPAVVVAAPVAGAVAARDALRRRRQRGSRSAASGDADVDAVRRTPHLDLSPSPRLTRGEIFEALVFADTRGPRRGEYTEPIVLVPPPDLDKYELQVWLVATQHFRVIGSPVQPFRLRSAEERTEVVRFRLEVVRPPGLDEEPVISASFSYQGRPSGKVTRVLSSAPDDAAAEEAAGLVVELDAVRPDLTVEILSIENDGRRFEVRVDSPLVELEDRTGTWSLPSASSTLVSQAMLRFFEPSAGRSARIASLRGAGLEFFDASPELFKSTFWRLHDLGRSPRNLYIVSDESSIPWELMVPRRRTEVGLETLEPLGVQLAVGRWHRDTQISPRQRVELQNSYVVAPAYVGSRALATSAAEAAYVCEHFNGTRIEPARFDKLNAVLSEGGADLLHFVCHGESDRGGVPVLLLEDPDVLDSQQVRAMQGLAAAIADRKPLVFLNACEAGRPMLGLLGASGFARSFIELDASGVIGTLWSVDDHAAHEVAVRFYGQLLEDPTMPFAEVLRRIRAKAFDVEGDDSYAAYCFYGDPSASMA